MSTAVDQTETVSPTNNAETAPNETPTCSEKNEKKKDDEVIVPVMHTFMIKTIEDNDDINKELALIGTVVQTVFHPEGFSEKEEEDVFFSYRFNEISAQDDQLEMRRSQTKGNCTRTTFQVNIPLEVETILPMFPFLIGTASVAIELSSKTFDYNGKTHRPDLILSQKDRRNNVNIQNLDTNVRDTNIGKEFVRELCLKRKKDNGPTYEKLLDKVDKSTTYGFLSPHPKVFYQYETGKDYCPRFVLTFYVAPEGFARFVQLVLPLLLVAVIATMSAIHDFQTEEGVEVPDHLQVNSALTLTIVFILPEIMSKGNRTDILTPGNIVVIAFFLGMLLSSIPRNFFSPGDEAAGVGYAIPEVIGVALMWIALVLPFWNTYRYWRILRDIERSAKKEMGEALFLADDEYKKKMHKPKNAEDELLTVGKIVKSEKFKNGLHDKYEPSDEEPRSDEEKPKYVRLHWRALAFTGEAQNDDMSGKTESKQAQDVDIADETESKQAKNVDMAGEIGLIQKETSSGFAVPIS